MEIKRIMETNMNDTDFLSWAAYHASKCPALENQRCSVSLLPLFNEVAHSAAMMLHLMHVVQAVIEYLNRGQTPSIKGDQPVYTFMKQLQWEGICR